ncbi:hypothetical protein EMIHUDRAFT_218452 [Emiliania huxleyi CCMP1516]|uniref:MerC domain-containing protein n=2 Tax=Emiliania huxleyi TaxID=2903 RepID=A0A0D3I8B1_EMIH1|nr:hypothetical protein EMIHUDRAFT_218452 [Emiliania huxleyi CCMP1516]EOD07496.1 hypothetical protein EMIHUDRAFT_218452 [Emiliania huxleyi CCMP1516]|eukprot:XP_005759925.1 hypothetical protein EMIHUDRAFT_218452 [Emiliania huxleyi CCMP1516]
MLRRFLLVAALAGLADALLPPPLRATATKQASTSGSRPFCFLTAKAEEEGSSWRTQLNRVSLFASLACAVDCTVFPVLLAALPLIGAISTGGATAWLHKASHAAALWFVGPVGGLAVAANWFQHKRAFVALWGLSGIALIILANVHLPHMILGLSMPHAIAQFLHTHHSLLNVLGCGVLLSSQRHAHSLTCCGGGHSH